MVATLNREDEVYRAVEMGLLRIDDDGSIWKVATRRVDRWGKRPKTWPHSPRRAENPTGMGYLQVRVMIDRTRVHALAHRLIWRHFMGTIPPGRVVNHKNGVKTDNRIMNLEIVTPSGNIQHAVHVLQVGRAANQNGERNHAAKLTATAVSEIRRRRASGELLKTIAADFGVSDRAVSKIALGQRWIVVG